MNIVVFVSDYPSKKGNDFVFVKQLVEQFGHSGHQCYVVSPWPILRKKGFHKIQSVEHYEGGGSVTVIRPNYLTIPFLRIGKIYPSEWLKNRAIKSAVRKIKNHPDVVYCHFWNQGLQAYRFTKAWNVPLIVACGESNISKLTNLSKITKEFTHAVKGVVCVSTKCKDESIELGLTTNEKCVVVPNAIDDRKFYVIDKNECREKLGIPKNKFVVCFVGWLIERKGPLRVMSAIEKLKNSSIGVIFVGNGPQVPEGDNILFMGSVEHSQLKYYLNAADIFVLPTLNEGCCNAVIEAMACGLPIISSNLPFNWDILNEKNSIMVDPNNIDEIAGAIKKMYENEILLKEMSKNVLQTVKSLTLDMRANRIIDFIQQQI